MKPNKYTYMKPDKYTYMKPDKASAYLSIVILSHAPLGGRLCT